MRINVKTVNDTRTHGGAKAVPFLTPMQQLRRSVLSCLLWEKEFYEDGQEIGSRIVSLAEQCSPKELSKLAEEARSTFNLRHVPLLMLTVLARTGSGSGLVSDTIAKTIQRADELSEFVALYWRNGKTPLSAQVKKGLAKAFVKFDEYQLAKYDRQNVVRLRDVLFLCHAKPRTSAQEELWKRLVSNALAAPDTWEVSLSAGADKKATWERLLSENRLGYLALLRNLRNMVEVGVDTDLIESAVLARRGAERVLPFRFTAAARACPRMEPVLDKALIASLDAVEPLSGNTLVLVDVSRSMISPLSFRSDLTRMDAAATLASIIPGKVTTVTFSSRTVEVPPRKGMAGVDAIINSQYHGSTRLSDAMHIVNEMSHDRLIVITDEQSTDYRPCPDPVAPRAYMINVASTKNGIGYGNGWTHIDGFSESVLRFIAEHEIL